MSVFFRRRGEPPATTIVVTIIRPGDKSYCYATINGTKQYKAGTYEVYAGDTITFGVYGSASQKSGWVVIDGTEVLRADAAKTETYDWTVPRGISAIEIAMEYSPGYQKGTITGTTA